MPLISVVIPLYNKADSIAATLRTVLAQTFTDFEVVVVDDGSTDGSAEAMRSITDPRVRLVQQPNGGVSAARNRGIAEARGRYIAFLDADDEWHPGYLAKQADMISLYPECAVFASNYSFRSHKGEEPTILNRLAITTHGKLDNYFEVACVSHPPLWTSAVVVSRDAILSIGGFPVGIASGEDLLTWARLACKYKIAYHMSPDAVYNLGEGYNFDNPPPRRQDAGDPVGLALKKLLQTTHTPHLRRYIGHWHKMRASVAIRYGARIECLSEAIKCLYYYPSNLKILPFLILPALPGGILKRVIRSYKS